MIGQQMWQLAIQDTKEGTECLVLEYPGADLGVPLPHTTNGVLFCFAKRQRWIREGRTCAAGQENCLVLYSMSSTRLAVILVPHKQDSKGTEEPLHLS